MVEHDPQAVHVPISEPYTRPTTPIIPVPPPLGSAPYHDVSRTGPAMTGTMPAPGVPPGTIPSTFPGAHPPIIVRPSSRARELEYADAERDRAARFDEAEQRFQDTLDLVEEGENRRDQIFQQNEDGRDRVFEDHENQRDAESRLRREDSVRLVQDRLATMPIPEARPDVAPPIAPPAIPSATQIPLQDVAAPAPHRPPTAVPSLAPSVAPSVAEAAAEAAARYSREIREILAAEREENARQLEKERAERAQMEAEHAEEQRRRTEEYQAQMRELEAQLAELQAEKDESRARELDAAQRHEDERQEDRDRNDQLSAQLGDVANIVVDQKALYAEKRQVQDARWEDKQARRAAKMTRWEDMQQQLRDLQREKKECKARMDAKANELENMMRGMIYQNSCITWVIDATHDRYAQLYERNVRRLEDRTPREHQRHVGRYVLFS